MSIIFVATSLSAVGASVLTVGALALRQRLARRDKTKSVGISPIQALAPEYAKLSGVTQSAVMSGTSDTMRWNTTRLDDPHQTLAAIGALQSRLTGASALGADRFNTSIALLGGKSDDA